ncbi:phosphate acetyltransferase [Anaerolineales bacterium HSG25]|nr:phosphate acetyltransferase [Anaerolineales bacterium HSG25]
MTKSIYITTTEPHCGKSLISLGLTELLLRKTRRIGIFRPVINGRSSHQHDKNIDLLLTHFQLDLHYEDTYAFRRRHMADLLAQGRYNEVMDRIIDRFKALQRKCDFVLCIGSDLSDSEFDFTSNAEIAKNLGCPVLIIGSAANRDANATINTIRIAVDSFLEHECQIVGTIINRAKQDEVADLLKRLTYSLPTADEFVYVIPDNQILSSPTVKEVADHLEAKVLYGRYHLDNLAYRYLVIAMQLQNYLPRLSEKALLITPGDRGDLILSALQAHQSHNYPQLAGILLTSDLRPADSVKRLLDGLPRTIPILAVEAGTYETATQVSAMRSYITADNPIKIELSLKLFEAYVDTKTLSEQISHIEVKGITPKMFVYNLTQQAMDKRQHIVLPEGYDRRVLKAAEYLLERRIVDLTILGRRDKIESSIQKLGLNIDMRQVNIIDPQDSRLSDTYANKLYELRQHKGLTKEQAQDLMCDVSYFGTMMVYLGHANGMVSGAVHTTQHTIIPALQFVRTKPGCSVVSSVFFMCLDDRILVYGDCAINPNPTAEELAEIAISSAETAQAFGIRPKVALLSYSSGASGKGIDVEKVRQATNLAHAKRPDLLIEGPIQYDAAVDADVGQTKMPNSEVAGQASVLVFPDLNTGNNTYKAVQRETGAIAIGPVLQGLNKPVNDLSRGCTVEDIINTIIITAIQAQG